MSEPDYLSNHILVAMPSLPDPEFFQTVVLICQHTEEGAMGIVLNRPSDISLSHLFRFIGLDNEAKEAPQRWDRFESTPVYMGGPVQRDRGFVLHSPTRSKSPWESTVRISPEISLTASRDILEAIAQGHGPEKYFVALGYSMWGPEQLEDELADNDWLTGPMTPGLLYDVDPPRCWEAAAASLGVNLMCLQEDAGHG